MLIFLINSLYSVTYNVSIYYYIFVINNLIRTIRQTIISTTALPNHDIKFYFNGIQNYIIQLYEIYYIRFLKQEREMCLK